MRSNFDFRPFRNATVGYDRLFDLMENSLTPQLNESYPPFDLIQEGEDHYRITIAVAGFRAEEIELMQQQNLLIVSGRRKQEDESRYIHRGIAARAFERRFALADYVQVKAADLRDGILSIELRREIPEEMKPRRIEIGGGRVSRIEGSSTGAKVESEKKKQLETA